MDYRESVGTDSAGVSRVAKIVRDQADKYGIKRKETIKGCVVAEEAALNLSSHASEGAEIKVHIRAFGGYMRVELSCAGDRYEFAEEMVENDIPGDDMGDRAHDMLSGILLKTMAQDLRYRHARGNNRISFTVSRSPKAFLYRTIGALLLAVIVGLILAWIGAEGFNSAIDEYLLIPAKTMYMNALKMVVAPVVFFSIVSCVARFSDIYELGRIGGRLILTFMFTMVIAMVVGLGVYYLFKPGSGMPSDAAVKAAGKITSQTVDVSFKDMIVGIIPSDLITPFQSSNMLQLIFLAVLLGIATAKTGEYSEKVKYAFEALNEIFLKVTSLIISFMPIAIFCSICSLIMETGFETITSILGMFATFVFGIICMIVVYMILIRTLGKRNPVSFLKNYSPYMLQIFSIASSNASIPLNLEACSKLGISKKIYSLAIPLGATLNMDGTCVYLIIFSLAFAGIYGIEISAATMVGMLVTIIVLAIGAPGIPGSGLICLSVLLAQIGVPTEAVGLVMGIDALAGMFRAMNNCTGDVVSSIIVERFTNGRSS